MTYFLLIHALVTLAVGIVLIVSPVTIPSSVGISVAPDQNLLCYLLGAAELAIGYLSLAARNITDAKSLRVIVMTFVIFHIATACVELLAITQGASPMLWGNVAVRVVVAVLFAKLRPQL